MANPGELKRGDIVEYVGNDTPRMRSAVGIVKCAPYVAHQLVATDVVWIYVPSAMGKALEGVWIVKNLKKLQL